jgi:hypothetical protein
MAQAAVAAPGAEAAAQTAEQAASQVVQRTIDFLDQDVISWSKQKVVVKISPDGRRETEEVSKWSAGVKVWELGIALVAIVAWEAIQILKEDLDQINKVGAWIENALTTIGSDVEGGFQELGAAEAKLFGINISENSTKKKLPAMPAMSAMGVLDAQLGVLFAQVLGPINLSGGQIVNGLIAGLAKKGGQL